MTAASDVKLELFGEGKTDIGKAEVSFVRPMSGVLPRLLHLLCGRPANMLVKGRPLSFLQGKGWVRKVHFAKRQAYYNGSDGVVFVMDTEGQLEQRNKDLAEGKAAQFPQFPMAVGAPHPCLEVWLLADPAAIMKGMGLPKRPEVPDDLEDLPAPCQDSKRNPKTVLAACCNASKSELAAIEKERIAAEMRDLQRVRDRCPVSFAPFADEVENLIRPLFS